MAVQIVLLISAIAYSMLVSQSFMYILSLKNAQLNLNAEAYLQLRKLIDLNMRKKFRWVIYLSLLSTLVLVVITISDPRSILFITASISFLMLVIDVLITVKGNIPVNDLINSWEKSGIPDDWTGYRIKWLRLFGYRQIVSITGWVSLLIGIVFGSCQF